MSRVSESSTPGNDLSSPPITAEEKIIPRQLAFFAGVNLQRNRIPRQAVFAAGEHTERSPTLALALALAEDRRARGESIRTVAAGVKVSIGVVHKTLADAKDSQADPAATRIRTAGDAKPGPPGPPGSLWSLTVRLLLKPHVG